ncbi:hypothetical protein B0H14DRAFT_2988589, partial [Mycena olivaceomarginata]
MTVMELATASQYNIGVKVLVLNNEFQGMVLQWQYLIYDARYSHTRMTNPDFVLLAEAMWVHHMDCLRFKAIPGSCCSSRCARRKRSILYFCAGRPWPRVFAPAHQRRNDWRLGGFGSV